MFAAKKKQKNQKSSDEKETPRTKSFGALWAGNVASEARDPTVAVHTLLLGTHPSVASLEHQQYYAHPLNAFWWIAGDCLGFRRASGRNKSGDGYYGFVSDLRQGEDDILPYHKQIDVMVTNGFALWDVVQSCHRPGSLDADIHDEIPNDIYGFCQEHPTIERIVFSNGGTGCKIFNKHFRDWWKSGQLIASTRNEESVKNFKSMTKLAQKEKEDAATTQQPPSSSRRKIECISALSVSPAAARYPYAEKRDFWDEHVYKPALRHQQDD